MVSKNMKQQVVATESDQDGVFQLLKKTKRLDQQLELVKESDEDTSLPSEEKTQDHDDLNVSRGSNTSKGSWSISLASLTLYREGGEKQDDDAVPLSIDMTKSSFKKTTSLCSISSTLSNSIHKVPKKSILRKTSSYNSFNANTSNRSSINRSLRSSVKLAGTEDDVTECSNNSAVTFQHVEVREYDRVLGDNPSCRSGVPISLDWNYSEKSQVSIKDYEDERDKRPSYARRLGKLPIHKVKRESILKDWAYTDDEIDAAKEQMKKVRRSKSLSNFTSQLIPWQVEDACSSLKRKVSRKMSRSSSCNDVIKTDSE